MKRLNEQESEFVERVVDINRVTKVVKGGRRFSFSALVVLGDRAGRVGFSIGKANEVPEAINKASRVAKKSCVRCYIHEGRTIPYAVVGKFASTRVILRPATPGTGVIAGRAVRAVLESVGVQDILTKCVGARNPKNAVRATLHGLLQLKSLKKNHQEGQEKKAPAEGTSETPKGSESSGKTD